MGDDRLDLITGWKGWKGLWRSAFSIMHSCVQAGAGSTATGGPPPEGLNKEKTSSEAAGQDSVCWPLVDKYIEDELLTHRQGAPMTLERLTAAILKSEGHLVGLRGSEADKCFDYSYFVRKGDSVQEFQLKCIHPLSKHLLGKHALENSWLFGDIMIFLSLYWEGD